MGFGNSGQPRNRGGRTRLGISRGLCWPRSRAAAPNEDFSSCSAATVLRHLKSFKMGVSDEPQPLWGAERVEIDDAAEIEKALRAAPPLARKLRYAVKNERLLADRGALYDFVLRLRGDARFAECAFELHSCAPCGIKVLNRRVLGAASDDAQRTAVRDAEFLVGHRTPKSARQILFSTICTFLVVLAVIICALFFTAGPSRMYKFPRDCENATVASVLKSINGAACKHIEMWNGVFFGVFIVLMSGIFCAMFRAAKIADGQTRQRTRHPEQHEIEWAEEIRVKRV